MSLVNDKSGTYCAQQANKTILGNLYSTIWIAMKANNCPLLVVTFVLLLSMASVWPVESSWTGELHRNEHRSALNTLKELDKYYAQVARPRFGKRFSTPLVPGDGGNERLISTSSADLLNPVDYRFILINRNQPMTKLTENYLKQMLTSRNLDGGQDRNEAYQR